MNNRLTTVSAIKDLVEVMIRLQNKTEKDLADKAKERVEFLLEQIE